MKDSPPQMQHINFNERLNISVSYIGNEKVPVIVIDDLVVSPKNLIKLAEKSETASENFQQQKSDFYPGIRKPVSTEYKQQLLELCLSLKSTFTLDSTEQARVIMSAFSIVTTPAEQLRPIQMLPHFDTVDHKQLAMVHYLCNAEHGGTSFYRHKKTGFERVSKQRMEKYGQLLKQEAIAEKLHERPRYMDKSTGLFEIIHFIEAKMNRIIVYPSNALHSGNIKPELGLSSVPSKGRLTISSFILLN